MGDDTIAVQKVCDQKESVILCTGERRNWWSCWLMEGVVQGVWVWMSGIYLTHPLPTRYPPVTFGLTHP